VYRLFLALALLIVAPVFWVRHCTGPSPEVRETRIVGPFSPGEPYVAEAVIHNDSWGEGPVRVVLALRDRASGLMFEEEQMVELGGGDSVLVSAEIRAPPGDYELEVDVSYPP